MSWTADWFSVEYASLVFSLAVMIFFFFVSKANQIVSFNLNNTGKDSHYVQIIMIENDEVKLANVQAMATAGEPRRSWEQSEATSALLFLLVPALCSFNLN